jgi:hypothetical protein
VRCYGVDHTYIGLRDPLPFSLLDCELAMASLSTNVDDQRPWWKDLTGYHWFVFAMASAAWVFDCLDQQVFILARGEALKALLPPGTDQPDINRYSVALGHWH